MKTIDAEKLKEYIKEECRKCYMGNRDLLQLQINIQDYIDSTPDAQVNVPKWISVDERLPENNLTVLINFNSDMRGSEIRDGYYVPSHNLWFYSGAYEDEIITVTHWMPLPTPPIQ